MKKFLWLSIVLVMVLAACSEQRAGLNKLAAATLNSAHVGATADTFGNVGTCPTPPAGQEGWYGWHFIAPGKDNNFVSLTVKFETAGEFSDTFNSVDPVTYETDNDVFISHPDESHAYIWTETADKLLSGTATVTGTNTSFNLSHVCVPVVTPYEELTVSETAVTSYTRTHAWDIKKSVSPSTLKLYINGSGDATVTWTVDVTYGGSEESGHNVSGEVTIENTGTLDAVITSVDDLMLDSKIEVDCGVTFPSTLAIDASLTCTYSQNVDGSKTDGTNVVTVTTERKSYNASAPVTWGDPTTEVNDSVTIEDTSNLFGTVTLGTATAPDNAKFTYTKDFKWADYNVYHNQNCGAFSYGNTATITETKQAASATLGVSVQCFVFKGDTAWAAGTRYVKSGNWATWTTYSGTAKTVTLFAGQTNNAGTVSFSAASGGQVTITVSLTSPWEFANVTSNLKVQGYASTPPASNPSPGSFANKTTCTTSTCSITVPQANFYGVHADVGRWLPDPSF